MPELDTSAVLFAGGLLAGVLNAVAGGGSFVTFPLLLGAGLPPVVANATNAVAVWPGHAVAAYADRHQLGTASRPLAASIAAAVGGAIAGALLLGVVGNDRFRLLIPYLLLFATALFAAGPTMARYAAQQPGTGALPGRPWVRFACEFAMATYGGFFGAGLGILLLAGLQLFGNGNLKTCNVLKNLLATLIGTVSVLVLIGAGWVSPGHAIWPFLGAALGGIAGARAARRLSSYWLRLAVIATGLLLSIHYFLKT
ncbi:MAG: sulfite exporter TauE/SafE family protein [Ramlibacter sp.]|nr:sulfite exporter TauE/SafE family protein [Ramlibacter sp.]